MNPSYSESDTSMSPTQILERLQVLRQLQLMQRGKLQKQRLQYQETGDTSSNITELVSQFSTTTSYDTFRSLLQSSRETSCDISPQLNTAELSKKVKEQDLIDGISVLNLSQESEFILNSPLSSQSRVSDPSRAEEIYINSPTCTNVETKAVPKKQISLDEMPILSPKLDFEALVTEKLKNEKIPPKNKNLKKDVLPTQNKKTFLRRGEGMARFGLQKNTLIIQNTKSLPWRQKWENRTIQSTVQNITDCQGKDQINIETLVTEPKKSSETNKNGDSVKSSNAQKKSEVTQPVQQKNEFSEELIDSSNCELHGINKSSPEIQMSKGKHPSLMNKGKTWAAILTKEQNDYLRKLKQSDYYKNFVSPAKSTYSDISSDENFTKLRQERETAEQNMFELLENKVCNESFHLENSFFNKFLKRSKLECSGENTPLIMQKCLAQNPELFHIFPDLVHKKNIDNSHSEADNNSEYTDCTDNCSSVSSCCSCKTVETVNDAIQTIKQNKEAKKNAQQRGPTTKQKIQEVDKVSNIKQCQADTVTEEMKANMVEMNAKLVATSELLKDRLCELEDEIETFRKENASLAKMREEIDLERQKFYEEKNSFEQKFNEEKILSEYYLAEEKEKLNKQKQTYERYVREMRGRLNKKEKDEVLNLKKEISDLKEEIRIKDAKSTSTIARLRNHLKIMEKEKKDLHEDIEKLKKENRRIQHSNDITRRLTNMKYLEQINKKLSHMASKDTQSEVYLDHDVKYKAFEIERQSRSRKINPEVKHVKQRAKSVPNLNVTSRYAKYFSQRDAISQMERDQTINVEYLNKYCDDGNDDTEPDDTESIQDNNISCNENENHLERIYMERFQSTSPTSNRSSLSNSYTEKHVFKDNPDEFFIRKSSNSNRDSRSTSPYLQNSNTALTMNRRKSPISILTHRANDYKSPANSMKDLPIVINHNNESNAQRTKSPISILSNKSSTSQRPTIINQEQYKDTLAVSPEPSTSKTSLTKTNLNPTEIKKSDGSRELRFPNGNVKHISADGKYTKFVYYNGDIKENFYNEGRIKYYYAEAKTFHTTHADGLEVLEFPDGQVEKRYKDGSTEIRLPNGSIRYFDPKNEHVREEWRFPDGTALTVGADGDQRIVFSNGQIEVHAKDHKRREFPDGTVKLVYNDGTSETRYASGRVRIKDKHGTLIMDSAPS